MYRHLETHRGTGACWPAGSGALVQEGSQTGSSSSPPFYFLAFLPLAQNPPALQDFSSMRPHPACGPSTSCCAMALIRTPSPAGGPPLFLLCAAAGPLPSRPAAFILRLRL